MENTSPRHPANKLFRYPHMFPLDIKIWDRFLDLFATNFLGFDYDIKVGSGSPIEPETPDNYARMQTVLSKYRIDAVGYTDGPIYIIEVKPDAGTIAIGQIETYRRLYERDFNPSRPVVGMIVTDREIPDMKYLTSMMGIMYYIV